MGLKKFYYSLENKWYDFVEKTGLYKITDKIDKFMPSLIFFILLIIMIIAGIFLLLPMIRGSGDIEISFAVMDESGAPIPAAPVLVSGNEKTFTLRTNDDGITGKVRFPRDTEYTVDIDYAGSSYESYSETFTATEDKEEEIYLTEIYVQNTVNYSFTLVDSETYRQITARGTADFTCSNPGAIAPSSVTITNGTVNVTANNDCQLKATIMLAGYETRYDVSITSSTYKIDFLASGGQLEGVTYPVYISVLKEDGQPLSGITAKLFSNNIEVFGKSCTTVTGVCTIVGVEAGNYSLKIIDTRTTPEYDTIDQDLYVSGTTNKTITLTRTVEGYIKVKVKKTNNQALENATVKLMYGDTVITSNTTNSEGIATLGVYDINRNYRVVASKEGFLVGSQSNVSASATIPTNPTITITLQQITPQTTATIKISVVNSETGKGFPHAQVVLYDNETGFLTDYDAKLTDSDGNCEFRVVPGSYYAKAFKGATSGTSDTFEAVIKSVTEDDQVIIIPIVVVKGTLNIKVVNNYDEPVSRANIQLFDKYSSERTVWGGDLTNVDGTYEITELTSDSEVYAVISDIEDNLGTTQSEFVYIKPNQANELKVTLYPKQTALQKTRIQFLGFYNEAGEKLNSYLRSGGDYKAKFLLLIPQDRDGSDEFDEVGAVIRTGSPGSVASPYMENDNIYIKSIALPNSVVTKYTQYSSEDGYDSISDVDTLTEGDAKWAKVVFNEIYRNNYANAYTIMADVKIKDTAVYGEEVSINYLGFGYKENNQYEVDPTDETNNDKIEYMTQKTETFNIGEEQACSDDFCFNLSVTNLDEDLREDVVDNYTASPNQHYKLRFGLINNNVNKIYNINSRLEIKNLDKGLSFSNIRVIQPNGSVTNIEANANTSEYAIPITQFNPHTKIIGDIDFTSVLTGDRQFELRFISDQKVIFTKLVIIHVLSDKTFSVKVTPKVIPSGKNFNLQVEVKDATTNIEVDSPVYVRVKDRFKRDLLPNPVLVGALGIASINNIPGQKSDDKIYVYVEAEEYETSITELEVTDNLFKITPTKLGVSLNINTKQSETAKFTIENLSEGQLTIESITFMGNDDQISVIDVARVNNSLQAYQNIDIPGVDSSESPAADNYNNKQEIEAKFFTSPIANSIKEVRNVSSKLIIKIRDKYNREYIWVKDLPVTLTVGYDGLMDDSHCITISEGSWEQTVVDRYVEKQFTIKNNCGVNSRSVPLNGGLSAKVQFDSNPLGVFTANVGSKLVELSHGYYKNIYDTVDSEKQYNVVLKYTPVGRYTGDIKGKIIFRSLNTTSSGAQELITEYPFVLHVISLKDCYTVSKKVLTAKDTGEPDSFVIENKGCGSEITYRLSCDQCTGLVLNPKEEIKVPATGSSEEIKVLSRGAMPGIYLLNVYSKVSGARGTEKNVGKVRVEVRPTMECLDLDRYEYDLFRYQYSENTGREVQAKSYDTGNIINRCYGQTVEVNGKVSDSARWKVALWNGLRDGLLTGLISTVVDNSGKISGIISGLIMDGYTAVTGKTTDPDETRKLNTNLLALITKSESLLKDAEGYDSKDKKTETEKEKLQTRLKELQEDFDPLITQDGDQTATENKQKIQDNLNAVRTILGQATEIKTCTPACVSPQTCDTTKGECVGGTTPEVKTCTPACVSPQTCDTTKGECVGGTTPEAKTCTPACVSPQTCDTTKGECVGGTTEQTGEQFCISKGYKPVTGYPWMYKCVSDTQYKVCYKDQKKEGETYTFKVNSPLKPLICK